MPQHLPQKPNRTIDLCCIKVGLYYGETVCSLRCGNWSYETSDILGCSAAKALWLTDVSGQRIGSLFKGQDVQDLMWRRNQQTHINAYLHFFVSLPYRISLMHGHGLFKTVQDLIYRERLRKFSNNKYVLTGTNYISSPAPGLIRTYCVHS